MFTIGILSKNLSILFRHNLAFLRNFPVSETKCFNPASVKCNKVLLDQLDKMKCSGGPIYGHVYIHVHP